MSFLSFPHRPYYSPISDNNKNNPNCLLKILERAPNPHRYQGTRILTPSKSFFLSSYERVSTRLSYLEATWILGYKRNEQSECCYKDMSSCWTYRVFASQSFWVETLLQGFVPELLLLSFLQLFQLQAKRVIYLDIYCIFRIGGGGLLTS